MATINDTALVLEEVRFVKVTLVSPLGEETLDVPANIAANDDLLRSLLSEHGVSSAANASIERAEDGSVKLTKRADQNG